MFDSLAKLFEKASSPGDIATVLVFGTTGFLIDAGLNAVGFLEPGVVGITAASGALGVKKSIEATLAARRERKAQQRNRLAETHRAAQLRTLLRDDQLKQRLDSAVNLFESGIIDIEAFKVSIDEIVDAYRSPSKGT